MYGQKKPPTAIGDFDAIGSMLATRQHNLVALLDKSNMLTDYRTVVAVLFFYRNSWNESTIIITKMIVAIMANSSGWFTVARSIGISVMSAIPRITSTSRLELTFFLVANRAMIFRRSEMECHAPL